MRLRGYGLFFIPTGLEYKKLYGIVNSLSAQHATSLFTPHLTLIGPLNGDRDYIISKTMELAKTIKKTKIKINGIDWGDDFYKCIFATVENTPELTYAATTSREIFELKSLNFNPHVSLMYGDLPSTKKEGIRQQLGDLEMSFVAERISLFSIEGEVEDWYRIQDFELK